MAYKSSGTAAKSSSGSSMSNYYVEVEERLQALEKGLAECKASCDSRASGTGDDASTAAKLETVIDKLNHQIGGF